MPNCNYVVFYTKAYNAENTIVRAIDSVCRQDFCGLQPLYIIIDNGSTDGTGAIIKKYAEHNRWIHPLRLDLNIPYGNMLIPAALRLCPDNGWFVSLDADDEYDSRFFKKILEFADNNSLDIASCGISIIDDETGGEIGQRLLDSDLIIDKDEYAAKFIYFRRFFMESWGKIYKLNLLKEWYKPVAQGVRRCALVDFEDTLDKVGCSRRIGILAEPLFKYYRSKHTYTGSFKPARLFVLPEHVAIIRRWLLQYGELSVENEDYLAAIYLGWCEHLLGQLWDADLTPNEKIGYVNTLFSFDYTNDMLTRNVSGNTFHNLSNRSIFLASVRKKLSELS
jgi:glycosyltransferase involved in cell wall biosynthesis